VSVARQLAVAGEDVLLLDQWGAGTGTTATTFAWTNSSRKHDPDYHRLNLAGMEEHARLAEQLRWPRRTSPAGHCNGRTAQTSSGSPTTSNDCSPPGIHRKDTPPRQRQQPDPHDSPAHRGGRLRPFTAPALMGA
jgi:hypothetical protein